VLWVHWLLALAAMAALVVVAHSWGRLALELLVKASKAAQTQLAREGDRREVVAHLLKALMGQRLTALLVARVQLLASRAVLSLTLVAVVVAVMRLALVALAVLVLVVLVAAGE